MMDEQTSDRTNDGETVNANFADHVMSRPAIGYVRVSTKGQGAKGVSLDAQRAGIESFANTAGYSLIETYKDVGSGVGAKSLVTRDGLRSALDHVLRENAHLIVYDWDRLSRHAGFESDILKYLHDRDRVVCAKHGNNMRDASRAGEFARNEAVAKEISQQTKDAMKRMRSEGAVFGNPKIREDVQPLGAAKWSQAADDLVWSSPEGERKLIYEPIVPAGFGPGFAQFALGDCQCMT